MSTPGAAPRVAVAIPAYRAVATIDETLGSVAAQTELAARGLDVALVDDGSADGTTEAATAWQDRIPGLRVITRENAGVASARNEAAAATSAPYICFLDSDDILQPDTLRQQADALDARPEVAVVYSSVHPFRVGPEGQRVASGERPLPQDPLHEHILRGAYTCLPSASMVRRAVFDDVGGFADGFESGEDHHFYVCVALAGHQFEHVDCPPLLYRMRPGQRSGDAVLSRAEMLRTLRWLKDELPPESAHRTHLLHRIRFLQLIQAGELDQRGERAAARRMVLASIPFPPRPGHLIEAARLYPNPARVLDWIGHPPEVRHERTRMD